MVDAVDSKSTSERSAGSSPAMGTMDFLCFEADHGKHFAIPLSDAISIMLDPVITSVPGTFDSFSGIANYQGELIAVVDISIAFSDKSENGKFVVVVSGEHVFGIKVAEMLGIVRDDLPDHCSLVDVKDFEKSLLAGNHFKANEIELF